MNHPTFQYVEVAKNGANNRNRVYNVRALGDPRGLRETYATYFRYNDDMIDHFEQTGSVRGYKGQAFADWLPVDIDSQNLQEAQDYLNQFVENLELHDIDPNACRFYFSGSKGFHVMIPSAVFNAIPCVDIHKRFRKVAEKLAFGIKVDFSIYDKIRIFRLPNTINAKSGLYKIELYPFQATGTPIADILEMAQQPVDRLDIETEVDANDELAGLFHESVEQKKALKDAGVEGVRAKLCLRTIMRGLSEGNRDNAGVRVATHLKESGLSAKMMWAALDEWNATNDPPLETHELERIYEQGLKEYSFGCNDFILKQYCDKRCIFYKEGRGH